MAQHSRVTEIKKARRQSLLLKTISKLFLQISFEDKRISGIFVSRVQVSPDKSRCVVYCYTPDGPSAFNQALDILKLYKPSMRTALAHEIKGRYTPEIVFAFDDQFEKQQRVQELLDQVKAEDTQD